jgi:hypothetical protein
MKQKGQSIIPQRNWTIVLVEKVLILNNGKDEKNMKKIQLRNKENWSKQMRVL